MARDVSDSTIVETRDDLVGAIASGSKPESAFRIGTEHEKFGFYTEDLRPVPYEGPRGIERILRLMEGLLGWHPIEDRGLIIGLVDPVGGGAISLEPGGQFELSGAPLENIHQTCRELHAHLAQVRECAAPLGIGFIGLGASPIWSLAETPVMPKSRYEIMARYMPKVGTRGLDMMFRTSTVQVNLDFSSEADMVRKMRVSLALQPLATALFANSPFLDNRANGLLSNRAEIWRDTDNQRSGLIPFVFEEGFGFEAYVDWALDVPMYFVKRGETYHDVAGQSFRDLLAGRLPGMPGERAMLSDWYNHLTTLFPDVRLKKYIEMRGADAGAWRALTALPAFWVGLLYDHEALDAAHDVIADWTSAERQALRDGVPRDGLATPFRNGTLASIAAEIVEIARAGLVRRARLNGEGVDESVYLHPLQETLASGMTPAERLLLAYRTDWQGDIGEVFRRNAY